MISAVSVVFLMISSRYYFVTFLVKKNEFLPSFSVLENVLLCLLSANRIFSMKTLYKIINRKPYKLCSIQSKQQTNFMRRFVLVIVKVCRVSLYFLNCLSGGYWIRHASIFPKTEFPKLVIAPNFAVKKCPPSIAIQRANYLKERFMQFWLVRRKCLV